jgi:hypothetical protein
VRNPKWWSLAALLTGLAVIAITGVFMSLHLRTVQPLGGAYGDQAMIAFELADTPEKLARVIGTDPPSAEAARIRSEMDRANRIDFLYIAVYAPFIACSCAALALRRHRRWLWLGLVLAPLAALCDIAENLALLALTRSGADVPALLAALHLRTFAKWELLACTSALFAAGFVGGGRYLVSALAALIALAALGAGILTFVDAAAYSPSLLDAIVVVWLWQLGYAALALFTSVVMRRAS